MSTVTVPLSTKSGSPTRMPPSSNTATASAASSSGQRKDVGQRRRIVEDERALEGLDAEKGGFVAVGVSLAAC